MYTPLELAQTVASIFGQFNNRPVSKIELENKFDKFEGKNCLRKYLADHKFASFGEFLRAFPNFFVKKEGGWGLSDQFEQKPLMDRIVQDRMNAEIKKNQSKAKHGAKPHTDNRKPSDLSRTTTTKPTDENTSYTDNRQPNILSSNTTFKPTDENKTPKTYSDLLGFFVSVERSTSQFYDLDTAKIFEMRTCSNYTLGTIFTGRTGEKLTEIKQHPKRRFTLEIKNDKVIVITSVCVPDRELSKRELETGVYAGKFQFVRDDGNLMAEKMKDSPYMAELEYKPSDGKHFNISKVLGESGDRMRMYWQKEKQVAPQEKPLENTNYRSIYIGLVVKTEVKNNTGNTFNILQSEKALVCALHSKHGQQVPSPAELGQFYRFFYKRIYDGKLGTYQRDFNRKARRLEKIQLNEYQTRITSDGLVEVKRVRGVFNAIIKLEDLENNSNIFFPIFGMVRIRRNVQRELLKRMRECKLNECRVAGTLISAAKLHNHLQEGNFACFTLTEVHGMEEVCDEPQSLKRSYNNSYSSYPRNQNFKRQKY